MLRKYIELGGNKPRLTSVETIKPFQNFDMHQSQRRVRGIPLTPLLVILPPFTVSYSLTRSNRATQMF